MQEPQQPAARLLTDGSRQARRAMDTTPAFWFSMFAASALGTNLGDFCVDGLSLDRWTSFAALAALAGLSILADRGAARRTDAGYWVAIVTLRAAATNVADFLTHDRKLGYVTISIVLGVATLLAGRFTRIDKTNNGSPTVDERYWGTMLIAGIFGTTVGDMTSHTFGLYAAAGSFCLALAIFIALRGRFAATSATAYWCVVLAERAAGTPVGDALASSRAVGLGLPIAMACTLALLLAGLTAYRLTPRSARR
ncbi:hypothetical protein [Rhodopila sp.]|uniref:hypothetical protein n=1 Tax=Rhodopila sp. TaxID=2480087 RepID=UPI003D0FC56A